MPYVQGMWSWNKNGTGAMTTAKKEVFTGL